MMILEANIPIGLGDLIYIKGQLDPFKNGFSEIKLTFDQGIINTYRAGNTKYIEFINEIGKLFFGELPYKLNVGTFTFKNQIEICQQYNIPITKPNLKHLLYGGTLLNINKEYIVINTKIRSILKHQWNLFKNDFWTTLRQLSNKYMIVILGEKIVEMSKEYQHYGNGFIYSIYNEIIANIPKERFIDLTIPALGITSPDFRQVKQDCTIMSEAKFVITLGIGGAFCMATAVANTIGYRADQDGLANMMYDNRTYPDAMITKDWNQFIHTLRRYL